MGLLLMGVVFVYAVFLSLSVGLTLWLDARSRRPNPHMPERLAPAVAASLADEAEEWLRGQ